jgi:hypothetical protein
VTNDVDTLATALYATTDDMPKEHPDLAGWAEYGYYASHSRFFWGLRLHLVCTLQGLPIAYDH